MGKQITKIINRFDRGIANDTRSGDLRKAQMIKNFEAHIWSSKLKPYINSATGDASANTNKIQNFAVAEYSTAEDYRLFGLGVSGDKAKVFVNSSLNSASWAALTNGTDSTDEAVDFELFVYYRKTDLLYSARAGDTIIKIDPADSASVADDHTLATSYNNPRESAAANRPYITGMVHSKDDILYVAYDNIIIKNDNGAWTDPALTLPTNRVITSICEYGNYLAIGTKNIDEVGNSVVYLWDRDSTLETLSESIDWGEGNLQVLEEIGGVLVGVSSTGTAATVLKSRFTFRYYAGGEPKVFKHLVSEDIHLLSDLKTVQRKVNDHLYFFLTLKLGNTTQEGIWKIGKHAQTGEMILSMAYPPNNDIALTDTKELHNFIINGDSVFISYTSNSKVEMKWINGGGSTWTASSIYETMILNEGDSSQTKKLIGVTVMTEPLPDGGQIVLKYKKDEETSWTTIFTQTVDDTNDADYQSLSHSAINIESTGATFPQHKEMQFQIISTGNAVPTGLKYKYELIKDDNYE